MAISVVVKTSRGIPVGDKLFWLTQARLWAIAETVPILHWVDVYGYTAFNARQCKELILQLNNATRVLDIGELVELAELAMGKSHRLLWFLGD